MMSGNALDPLAQHAWGISPFQDRVWARVCGIGSAARTRLLMSIQVQACVDDSYSKQSGIYVLGGAIATAERWAAFAREWEEMPVIAKLQRSGKRAFKMTEMKSSEFLPAYYKTIQKHAMCTFGFAFNINEFERSLAKFSALPFLNVEWSKAANHFIFAFAILMNAISSQKSEIDKRIGTTERIDFIFDNHGDKRAILLGWDLFVNTLGDEFRRHFGATPRFDDDEDFLPLQAADFEAGYIRNPLERGIKPMSDNNTVCPHLRMWMDEKHIMRLINQMVRSGLQEASERPVDD
jgi:Protein of unknown function (DUF3800)